MGGLIFSADPCLEPVKVGPCEARKLRFYYNQENGQCEPFSWGGCKANGNNFQSMSECAARCPSQGICKPFHLLHCQPRVKVTSCFVYNHRVKH